MIEQRGNIRRTLTDREASTLAFMLAVEDPRLEPLRHQAQSAIVTWVCTCGCATINLDVDRLKSTAAVGLCSAAIHTYRRAPYDADDFCELIVLLEDGWLSSLELVWYANPISEFPPSDECERPGVRC